MTNRAAAARYARALFEVSCDTGNPERTDRDLVEFCSVLDGHHMLKNALLNPAISAVQKRAVVDAILHKSPETTEVVNRLLLMLAERDRLNLLPILVGIYRGMLMEHLGIVSVCITTAEPLDPRRVKSITRTLSTAMGRKVEIETKLNETLLGGMVTQIGSTVFDGSIAHHLDQLGKNFLAGT